MTKGKKTLSATTSQQGIYNKFETWFERNDKKIFYTLTGLCLFLSFITFNARISEAHDDALYLEGGWRYVKEFPNYFYTQNAPLYPMFLGLMIKLIGFKLIIFKIISIVFNLFGFVFFYKALKGRIPAIVFLPVAVFQASNHLIMYFASMTFTEAFYFFLQGLFFLYAIKIWDKIKANGVNLKADRKTWLMLGLSMFLISTAKSSAIVVIPALMLFFMAEKNWKGLGATVASYLIFKVPFELIVRSVWNAQNQFKGQSKILLQKDPYDKALGDEDFSGFIQRFLTNSNLSLSKRFYQLIGWKDETSIDLNGFVTLITIALILTGFWFLLKNRKKEMIMLSLFTGAQLVLSFIILQARWDQPRITLVCMPVLLILMLYAIYSLTIKPGIGQTVYIVIAGIMVGSVLMSSFKRGFKNLPIVQKNLKGDTYYGYTPDWSNFLKCSAWCADSLPETSLVASRKAPMSFVYGKGKKFFPVYSVIKKDSSTNQSHPDSALSYFQKNNVSHVMLASLRLNPLDPNAGFINTMHNIVVPIARKYPEKLRLVHTEGQFEEASVYEILY
jgi:hypothetical protein